MCIFYIGYHFSCILKSYFASTEAAEEWERRLFLFWNVWDLPHHLGYSRNFFFCRKNLEYGQNTELPKSDAMPADINVLQLHVLHLLLSRLLWHTEQPIEKETSRHSNSEPPVVGRIIEAKYRRSASLFTTASSRFFNRLSTRRSVAAMSLHRLLKVAGVENVNEEMLVWKHLVV